MKLLALTRLAWASTLIWCSAASALEVYIDQDASYRYAQANAGSNSIVVPSNWYAYGFDDSGWANGSGPFSSSGAGTFGADLGNVNGPFAPGATEPLPSSFTHWDVHADPYVRFRFNLTGPSALTLWMAVDNGINSIYLNGVATTAAFNAEGQAFRWEHVLDIPANYTFTGENVLALQLEDHGGATAFALMLTGNDAADHTTFTTNAPPTPPTTNQTPEPGSLLLIGMALASLALARHRRRT